MTINIALIDDHTLFRSGIKALLSRQTEFSIVGEASDGFSGVKLVEQTRPDVVLLDLNMPQMNGRDALAQILSSRPEQKVIMLTVSEDSEDLTECIRLGASGFLLKNINANYLIESIKKVVNGDNAYSPEMTARLVQSLIRPAQAESALSQLTPRELETLGHLAAGYSNKTIAKNLNLAESTIKVHVQNILRKLKLDSRVQAAYFTEAANASGQGKLVANWMNGELAATLNKEGLELSGCPITAERLAALVGKIADGTLSSKLAKKAFEAMWAEPEATIEQIIDKYGLVQITDTGAIEAMVDEVLANNAKAVEQFKAGNEKALNAIVGQVMKASKGKANPAQVQELVKAKLG